MAELKLPIRARGVFVKILVRIPRGGRVHELPLPAFLDTGTSDTMVDIGVIESLQLEPCNQVSLNILGCFDPGFYATFQIEVALLGHDATMRWIPLTVLGGPCFQTGAAAALGRDFLRHHRFEYDGLVGKAMLSW
jgi:hypothetical protein